MALPLLAAAGKAGFEFLKPSIQAQREKMLGQAAAKNDARGKSKDRMRKKKKKPKKPKKKKQGKIERGATKLITATWVLGLVGGGIVVAAALATKR